MCIRDSTWSSAARVGCSGSSTKSTVNTECAVEGMPRGLPGEEPISILSNDCPSARRRYLEAFGWAAFVAGEAQPQDAKAMSGAVLDLAEVGGVETERCPAPGADRGGKCGLTYDRREHRRLERGRQRKASGETHADHAHARAAALAERHGGQRPQPGGDSAGAVGEDGELPRDAHPSDGPSNRGVAERLARSAEQRRQEDRVPGVDQPLRELDHARVQPGHLMDDDHRWTCPGAEHLMGTPVVGEHRMSNPANEPACWVTTPPTFARCSCSQWERQQRHCQTVMSRSCAAPTTASSYGCPSGDAGTAHTDGSAPTSPPHPPANQPWPTSTPPPAGPGCPTGEPPRYSLRPAAARR